MLRQRNLLLLAAALLTAPQTACAQAGQLPTFRYFSVQTTVSVPDRGGMMLGGVNRSSSGSTSRGFGPLRNRASGSNSSATGVSVHATIIDHNELDQAVLAEARARRGDLPLMLQPPTRRIDPAIAAKSDFLSRNIAARENEPAPRLAVEPPVESLSAIRAAAAARASAKQQEALDKLAAGIAAEESGKLASARGAYEAAIRLGDDEIRSEASARLARIALPAKGAKVAGP